MDLLKIHSSFQPDHDYWIKHDKWTLTEASLLLVDVDPDFVTDKYSGEAEMCDANIDIEMYLEKLDKLLTVGPYSTIRTRSPQDILKWARSKKIPIPNGLEEAALNIGILDTKDDIKNTDKNALLDQQEIVVPSDKHSKFKKLRADQRHRERCRVIAEMTWSKTPDINIESMICSDEITKFGCEGKNYGLVTIREWINDLAPNRAPGRPVNKKPK